MTAPKNQRKTIKIARLGYIHILIEQTRPEDRPDWQKGCYMGYQGYVLHKIEKL